MTRIKQIIWWPTSVCARKLGLDRDVLVYYKERGVFKEHLHFRKDTMSGGYTWNVEATGQRLAEAKREFASSKAA